MVPENARRPLEGALDLDRRARRGDQVDGDVVGGDGQVLAEDLDRMNGGRDARLCRDGARLRKERVLQVAEAATLADPCALQVHRDRAAEDQVQLRDLLDV